MNLALKDSFFMAGKPSCDDMGTDDMTPRAAYHALQYSITENSDDVTIILLTVVPTSILCCSTSRGALAYGTYLSIWLLIFLKCS